MSSLIVNKQGEVGWGGALVLVLGVGKIEPRGKSGS